MNEGEANKGKRSRGFQSKRRGRGRASGEQEPGRMFLVAGGGRFLSSTQGAREQAFSRVNLDQGKEEVTSADQRESKPLRQPTRRQPTGLCRLVGGQRRDTRVIQAIRGTPRKIPKGKMRTKG